jgi:hypothetical protein
MNKKQKALLAMKRKSSDVKSTFPHRSQKGPSLDKMLKHMSTHAHAAPWMIGPGKKHSYNG